MAEAIGKVLSEVIVDFIVTVNVISINNNHDSNDFRDALIREITKNPVILIRQQMLEQITSLGRRGPRKSAVLILRSFPDFLKFYSTLIREPRDLYETRGYYFLLLVNGKINEIEKIFEMLWKIQIYNANVLFEENNTISVFTFFPFRSNDDCSNIHPVLINQYNGKFTNDIRNFFPLKMNNLERCQVRVATSNASVPYIFMKMLDGEERLWGRDYDLIQTLSQTLNFQINFTYIGIEGYLFEKNGTAGGTFLYLMNGNADLTIADYWLKSYRLSHFDASTSYINEKIVFVLPRGSELSSIEKLLYPLTFSTWIMVIACFIAGYLVIFIVKLQSKAIQNFVFGKNVKYPYLNMWIGLIGNVMHKMPGRNFSRFILTIFLLFSIIIRTAYQGKMYQMIQSNKKHREPQTIDEMVENDFTFHLLHNYVDLINDKTKFKKNIKLRNSNDVGKWVKQVNGDVKNAVLMPYSQIYYKLIDNNTLDLSISRDVFLTMPTVIYTTRNYYLLYAINEKIEAYKAFGLIEYWHSLAFDKKHMKIDVSKRPKILTFTHLTGCFELYAVGCLISTLIFSYECFSIMWKNWRKKKLIS